METPQTYYDLFFGYSAVWLLLATVVVRMWMKLQSISRQLDRLEGAQISRNEMFQQKKTIRANS